MSYSLAQLQAIQHWLTELCINIGERPTGWPSNRKAAAYIGTILQQHGYAVEFQEFECLDWRGHSVSVQLGNQPVPAAIAPYSLPCEITTAYATVGSLTELDACEVQGKIVVLHGELTQTALMPKNFRFWNPEEHQHILHLLETKRPAALLTVSFSEDLPIPIIEDGDFNIPCAVIARQYAPALLAQVASPLTLKIISTRAQSTGANVIARKPSPSSRKKLVLTAHLDTKPGTPGALDNASGVVALLMLSHLVHAHALKFDLEFVFFNGEDYYSSAGEVAYLEQYQNEFANILLNLNCDGVGLANSNIGAAYIACPETLIASCERARQRHSLVEVIEPWYQGDHMIFVPHQVPALAITSSNIFPLVDTLVHTQQDTPAVLDTTAILHTAQYLQSVVEECNAQAPAA